MGDPRNDQSGGVEQLARRIDEYEGLQKNVFLMRMTVMLGFFLIVCGFIWGLVSQLQSLTSRQTQDQIQTEVANRLRMSSPEIMAQFKRFGERVLPVYSKAIQEHAAEKMPGYLVQLDGEYQKFTEYFDKDLRVRLNDRFMAILERQTEELLKRYPDLGDAEVSNRLMGNVQIILSDALYGVLMEKVDGHINEIAHIQQRVNDLVKKADVVDEQHAEAKLLAATLELVGRKMSQEIYAMEGGK